MKSLIIFIILAVCIPVYADEVRFLWPDERICPNCKVVYKGGYIDSVIHPKEGEWELAPGQSIMVTPKYGGNVETYKVSPKYKFIRKQI